MYAQFIFTLMVVIPTLFFMWAARKQRRKELDENPHSDWIEDEEGLEDTAEALAADIAMIELRDPLEDTTEMRTELAGIEEKIIEDDSWTRGDEGP